MRSRALAAPGCNPPFVASYRFVLLASAIGIAIATSSDAAPLRAEARFVLAFPSDPQSFGDGWDTGRGIAGGAQWLLGSRWAAGLEGTFTQFAASDLGDVAIGGTRRTGRVAVPVAWRWNPQGRVQMEAVGSFGYGHQSTQPISGGPVPEKGSRDDGIGWSAGLGVTIPWIASTAFAIDVRYEALRFQDSRLAHTGLWLGLRTSTSGSH